jgi:hypothetical protein
MSVGGRKSTMDDLSFRLNLNLSQKNKIYHRGWKELLGICNTAKFGGCEML